MVDTRLLKAAMVARGYTQLDVAKQLNLSASAFNKKVNGKVPFNTNEVAIMLNVLDLSADVVKVFFAQKMS